MKVVVRWCQKESPHISVHLYCKTAILSMFYNSLSILMRPCPTTPTVWVRRHHISGQPWQDSQRTCLTWLGWDKNCSSLTETHPKQELICVRQSQVWNQEIKRLGLSTAELPASNKCLNGSRLAWPRESVTKKKT